MRVDYRKVFAGGVQAMAGLERALTLAIVAINGWNRLAVGLRSDVLGLDGLDLPESGNT